MQLFAPNTYGFVAITFDNSGAATAEGASTKITIPDMGEYKLVSTGDYYLIIFRNVGGYTVFGFVDDNSGDAVMVNASAPNATRLSYEQSSSTPLPYTLWSATFKE